MTKQFSQLVNEIPRQFS